MFRGLFLASFLMPWLVAVADTAPVPVCPACPVAPVVPVEPMGPTAHILYDCADGPGYLVITVVDVYGNHTRRQPFLGSRAECLNQAAVLRASRSLVAQPALIAVCSPSPTYQLRWQVDGWGNVTPLPQTYFKHHDECIADATAINRG